MLLENNTERIINLVDIIDDLKGIDKIRLAIHLLEESYFSTEYDENFIKSLKQVLEILDSESKKVITNFAKYKNLLFNIFQYNFKNEEINTKINEQLNVYDYCYSLNVL